MLSLETMVQSVMYLIVAGLIFWLLGDMAPSLAVYDCADLSHRHTNLIGELLLSDTSVAVPLADGSHLRAGQLGMGGFFPPLPTTAFASLIGHVVSMRPKEKMAGIDAARLITRMTDFQLLGDGAFMQLPSNTVSQQDATVSATPVDDAIASVVDSPCPQRASGFSWWPGSLLHMDTQGHFSASVMATWAAKRIGSGRLAGVFQERFSTHGTSISDLFATMTGHTESPRKIQCEGVA